MHIAIISDVHNNLTNLKKVLDYCTQNNIEKIICCGDLASMETLDFLNDNFDPPSVAAEPLQEPVIFYTFGNMDNDHLKNYDFADIYKKTRIFKGYGEITIDDRKIAFVHFPQKAKELCETGKYDFVFHGHTHKPWTEKIGNCILLNPGNVAGEIYPPTFAVWNTENNKFELMRIQGL